MPGAALGAAWPGPWALVALGYAAGLALIVGGLWFMAGARDLALGQGTRATRGARGWRDRLTIPTRYAIALAAILGGYHLVSWSSPPHWLGLRVPPERWWLVVLVAAAAVIGSVLNDRLLASRDDVTNA